MRHVEVISGVSSSAIGFGCAGVCGSIDRERSFEAIRTALDCGVNHFDLAPSYGYGVAEAFVGAALPSDRDSVVLATKFGISPTLLAQALTPLKGVARKLNQRRSASHTSVPANSSAKPDVAAPQSSIKSFVGSLLFKRLKMDPVLMEKSFYQSLSNLRVEHLDYLMLHEPLCSLDNVEELLEVGQTLKNSGCLRGFGISVSEEAYDLHRSYMKHFDFIQMPGSPLNSIYESARSDTEVVGSILYSIFQGLGASQDFDHEQALNQIQLDFPSSVLLCSMSTPAHIKRNAELFQ